MNFFRLGDEIECLFILDVQYNSDVVLCLHSLLLAENFQKQHGGVQRGSDAKDCSGEAKV